MYRKILLGGVTAAVIVGAGGTALALTGSDSPTPGTGSSSSSHAKGKHDHAKGDHKGGKRGKMLRRLAHGQFTTKGKDGKYVTHDLITGTVTSVSATSITVQSADKKSETFAVDKDTKVRERTVGHKGSNGKPTKGSAKDEKISDVAKGEHVIVLGTGTSKYTAKHIVEIKGTK